MEEYEKVCEQLRLKGWLASAVFAASGRTVTMWTRLNNIIFTVWHSRQDCWELFESSNNSVETMR